jgi:hypothetical protein
MRYWLLYLRCWLLARRWRNAAPTYAGATVEWSPVAEVRTVEPLSDEFTTPHEQRQHDHEEIDRIVREFRDGMDNAWTDMCQRWPWLAGATFTATTDTISMPAIPA